MKVEQILQKKSLDQMLHLKSNAEMEERSRKDQMIVVGNYLDLPVGAPSFFNQQSLNQNQYQQITLNFENPASCNEFSTNFRDNREKKRSVFHNFQKHLMTTLRSHIKIRKISHSSRSQSNIASQLWQHIKKSSCPSRRFLLAFLFGRGDDRTVGSNYYEDYARMITQFNEYTEQELNLAQAYLCRQVVRQSKKLIQNGALEGRRMNNSEQFKIYFKRFIDDLENGRLSKRMHKTPKFVKNQSNEENHIYYDQH